jgi:hypothetical protein
MKIRGPKSAPPMLSEMPHIADGEGNRENPGPKSAGGDELG